MLPLKDLLIRARKDKKLTQNQVADLMQIHRPNYNRLEKGKADMTHTMILRFCDAIGITIQEFYKEDSSEDQYLIKINKLKAEDRKAVYKLIDEKLDKPKLSFHNAS